MRSQRAIEMEQTYIEKFGSYEAYKQFMQERGRKGGKKSRGGGFAANPELAREAGRRGGMVKRVKLLDCEHKHETKEVSDGVSYMRCDNCKSVRRVE